LTLPTSIYAEKVNAIITAVSNGYFKKITGSFPDLKEFKVIKVKVIDAEKFMTAYHRGCWVEKKSRYYQFKKGDEGYIVPFWDNLEYLQELGLSKLKEEIFNEKDAHLERYFAQFDPKRP